MKKLCLECGDTFQGRFDKKYCSDQCRAAYYNKKNSDTTNLMRNINNTLRKNRRILFKLNPNGKRRVHRDKLLQEGFKFNYHTNVFKTKESAYYFCYDQGYRFLEDSYCSLVKRQEYVE